MDSLVKAAIALVITILVGALLILVLKKWLADDNKEREKYYRVIIIALSAASFGMALFFLFKD